VLEAVERSCNSYQYAAGKKKKAVKMNSEVTLATVEQDGLALQFSGPKLRKNKDLVLAAVKNNGHALKYASVKLRKDREVVSAAVASAPDALQYAGAALRPKDKSGGRDKELALMAVTKSGSAFRYVSSKLRADKEVRRAYEKQLTGPTPSAAAFPPSALVRVQTAPGGL